MEFQIVDDGSRRCLEVISAERPLGSEQDALDLVGLCWEHSVSALLLPLAALSPAFFDLRTKVAGDMIQKFINYGIRAAAVIPQDVPATDRFREMAAEANKGTHFRIYESRQDALAWLTDRSSQSR